MSVHLLGQGGSDANEPAGYLPRQVVNTAYDRIDPESNSFSTEIMGMVERTLRRAAPSKAAGVQIINKKNVKYTGKRTKLWKSRETGNWLWVWPERGFVHIERDDGEYKKWMLRDALALADAFGEQIDRVKWPDEKQNCRNAYLTMKEVCAEARRQGDPTEMTPEEQRSLRESVACAVLPGYGDKIPAKKVTFVGANIAQGAQ